MPAKSELADALVNSRLQTLEGKWVTLNRNYGPTEWFTIDSCGHFPSHCIEQECIAASDDCLVGARVYYHQSWLNSTTCQGCFKPYPGSVPAYEMLPRRRKGKRPHIRDVYIFVLICPYCEMVRMAYEPVGAGHMKDSPQEEPDESDNDKPL